MLTLTETNSPLGVWWQAMLGFFYPNICQVCRRQASGPEQGYVCTACFNRPGAVRFLAAPLCQRCGLPFEGDITVEFECSNCREMELEFTSARAAVAAQGLVLEIIHRYKYNRAMWFEPFLAGLLVRRAGPVLKLSDWDLIVPVPLHPLKEREREFNQAERMSRSLSAATGIPVGRHMLERVVPTRTQTRLSRSERARNVAGAFGLRKGKEVRGLRIVLVDDVLTTGATTNACAKVLRSKGSGEVCVWTVARGL